MKVLKQELQQMQPQAGRCRVEVSHEEIFEVGSQASCSYCVLAMIPLTSGYEVCLSKRFFHLGVSQHKEHEMSFIKKSTSEV